LALIDFNERQLTLKLVYYGPPRSGKTTNLHWIHSQVASANRGRLMTLDTKDDRTLFFDLLPIFFRVSALSFRVKVYTVPGQPTHEATRRVVLRQADGVVFVADSRTDQVGSNQESYANLCENLERLGAGKPGSTPPVVIQYNKRDLAGIVPPDAMKPLAEGQLVFPASALAGAGVMDTFFGVLTETWRSVDREFHLAERFKLPEQEFMSAVRAHVSGHVGEPPR
jgi:mutual gliding-motility protein MglA